MIREFDYGNAPQTMVVDAEMGTRSQIDGDRGRDCQDQG